MIKFHKSIKVDNELKERIVKLIPADPQGLVVKVTQDSEQFFSFTLRLAITTKEAALGWIKEFEETSVTTYRVGQTFAENTPLVLFKKKFRCIQNSYPKKTTQKPHEKHTKCRATVSTVIKQQIKKSRDPYLQKYPCEVNVNWLHNHTVDYEALKYRRPDELWTIFAAYFSNGHSPCSALELHKMKLQTEYGDDYYKVAADGSRCPSRIWCYKLYYKIFQRTCKDPSMDDMLVSLGKYIEDYNEKCQDTCAMMSKDMCTSNDVVVSICSPLSKRVLTLKSVQEIMFVTSSGNRVNSSGNSSGKRHKHNSRVFLLLSPSVAGALPLGIIVSTSEREVVITKGIEMLKDMLQVPDFSPKIIITDDSEVERNSLTKMFPVSAVLLCKSHVLQTVWRFLSDPKNNVLQDKVTIFKQFSTLLHSKTKELFDENFMKLMNLDCIVNNINLSSYFNNYKRREMEWALYARVNVMMRNKYTYHNSEASIRVLKEQILHRTKSFSVLQLVDAMTSALTCYYETRLLNCVKNRAQAWESKYYMPAEKIQGLECKQTNDTEYTVTHEKGEECVVNHEIGACTCPQSIDGTLCKHQYAVLCKFNLHSEQFVPTKDVVAKKHLYYVATGEQLTEDGVRWSGGFLVNSDIEVKKEIVIKKEPVQEYEEEEEPEVAEEIHVQKKVQKKSPGKKKKRTEDSEKDEMSEDEAQETGIVPKKRKAKKRKRDASNENLEPKKIPKKRRAKQRKLDEGELCERENKIKKVPKKRKIKQKKQDVDSEDEASVNEEDYAMDNDEDLDHDDNEGEEDFLFDEYTDMVKEVQVQQANSNRDADIEKELILEELKDMVKVVPSQQDDSSIVTQSKDIEKELLLRELKDMFKLTGEKLINKYDIFKPAIQAMITAFKSVKSESTLLSFYHAVGNYNPTPNPGIRRNLPESEPEKVSNTYIENPIIKHTNTLQESEVPNTINRYTGNHPSLKRYLQESEPQATPIKYIPTPELKRIQQPTETPGYASNHIQTFNLQQSAVGNYTYLQHLSTNEEYYNMVVGHHNDLQVQQNVTIQ